MAKNASATDYIEIQGEMPSVEERSGLTIVKYADGTEIPSHINHGTVTLNTNLGPKEFKVDLLRQFHGDPCERQSRSLGGDPYSKR